MEQYRKKPVIVNAVQFFYDSPELDCVTYPAKSKDGRTYIGDAYVTTIHGDNISVFNGERNNFYGHDATNHSDHHK